MSRDYTFSVIVVVVWYEQVVLLQGLCEHLPEDCSAVHERDHNKGQSNHPERVVFFRFYFHGARAWGDGRSNGQDRSL